MNVNDERPNAEKSVKSPIYKIKVIEDDDGLNRLIQKKLQKEGYSTDGAFTGQEALGKIGGDENEILLIDYKLPDMTGKQLVKKILEKYSHIPPIIVITGFGDEKIAVEMMKLGVWDYMVKEPDFIDILPEKIKHLCADIEKNKKLKKAEDDLRKNLEILKDTGEMARVGGWEIDLHENTVHWTQSTKKIHEVADDYVPTLEEAINFYPQESRSIVEKAIREALEQGKSYDIEIPIITAKGKWVWTHSIGKPEMKDGKCVRLRGTFQDITERKNALEDIRANQATLKRTEKIAHVGSWDWDIATDKVIWSDELFQIFRLNPEKGGVSYADHPKIYTPESMQRLDGAVQHTLKTGDPYEIDLEIVRGDGTKAFCTVRGFAKKDENGNVTGLYGSFQDISERKLLEEEIRKAGEFLKKTEKTGKIGGWQFNPATMKQTWTDEVFRILEIELEMDAPLVPQGLEFIDQEFRPMAEKAIQRAIDQGEPYNQEWMVTTAKGNKKWVNAVCNPTLENGKVVAISGSFQDITSKKIIQEELKKSEERLKLVLDNSPFPVAMVDEKDQNISFWSKSAVELFGHDPKTTKEWYELAYPNPEYRQEVIERWKPLLKTAQRSKNAVNTGEYEIHCKNGEVKICELFAQFIPGNLIVTLNDITERKKAEEQLKALNQQLVANEQQLRAANQQLQANEQQLRAANRELVAGEQQLLASNQQLKANQQQLRAANQQLQANEQQLRAANHQLSESEKHLRDSKETAESYLNIAAEIILSLDLKGNISMLNDSGYQLLGFDKGELIGKDWFKNCVPEKEVGEVNRVFSQLITGEVENVANYASDILTKSGEKKTILWHNTVTKDKCGKITGTLSSGEDITERVKAVNDLAAREQNLNAVNQQLKANEQQLRAANQQLNASEKQLRQINKKLEESENRYRNLVDLASDGIYLVSGDAVIIDATQGALKMLGKTRDEIVGKSLDSVDPNYSTREFLDLWNDVPLNKQLRFESTHQHKNGDLIPVEVNAQKYQKDGKTFFYSIARDITERKQSEAELKKIEWLLQPKKEKTEVITPEYGDLTALNTDRTILDAVGKKMLNGIVADYLSLLETSAAVYEKNGDYAVGIFSSEWCQFMDCSSRAQCNTKDNKKALRTGKWLCHESCWADASNQSILTKKPADIECSGGLHIYAIPIMANDEVIGSINFGYGNPPTDEDKLTELAAQYQVSLDKLKKLAHSYETRPAFIIDIAKEKLASSARLIGNIVERRQMEVALIEAKEKAQESEANISAIIEGTNNSIWAFNRNYQLLYINHVFQEEFLRSFGVLLKPGMSLVESLPEPLQPLWKPRYDRVLANEQFTFEDAVPTKTGTVYIQVSFNPIVKNGEVIGGSCFGSDITERKLAELELVKAKEKAEESDRLKSAFLANMSHEIRTPMNGILGFTNLLQKPNLSGEEQQKYIDIIQKSGSRMLNTVNDIIDISRIESGLVELSLLEVNIYEQLNYLYSFFKPEAAKKGLQLILNCDRNDTNNKVVTDIDKFTSIVTNLIKNAIKFTNQGTIELGYQVLKENGISQFEFYVKDSGVGIPKERQHAIFDRFVQADIDDKKAVQGSGLGLAISQAYAKMLGGKLWVESVEGVGSTFYFTIECRSAVAPKLVKSNDVSIPKEDIDRKKFKILVVEDDEPSRDLISIMIGKFAKEIIEVSSGLEAVEVCRKDADIDLVLMDIQMPGINGYEATKQIREFNKEVVILAQTAYALTGDREKAIDVGCNDYISKPINMHELDDLIKLYLM